ncbi:MAG: Hsp20 family protein [Candidatus Microthrix sp.]|jgi:HSP20 family molecular chaperone IbpA|nr:Hsp20/alpha crystallin family protein [Candidatus Microthrix sp.]MBK6437303.1 Hsp20 family protein [Candidatus Microthrix sp.]MBK7166860.1 Hsp20 family protein [Candidatus Microthrix sp.]MBP7596304.1 Hsp20/alpha crystallin family protein [Candidatus Microthrix sp.]MBP9066089.1 Hsp20/alpha crystallin family protein [Candidatus Microthrix sp.]
MSTSTDDHDESNRSAGRAEGHDGASHEEVLASTREAQHRLEASPQRVPINAYRSDAAFVVVAPVPGVSPEDVHVELRQGSVRFWTNVRSATTRTYDVHEWHYGGYERTIEVPDGFGASVLVSLGNGQLVIRVAAGPFGGDVDLQATQADADHHLATD